MKMTLTFAILAILISIKSNTIIQALGTTTKRNDITKVSRQIRVITRIQNFNDSLLVAKQDLIIKKNYIKLKKKKEIVTANNFN